MNLQTTLNEFISFLIAESGQQGIAIPHDEAGRWRLLRALMNIRPPDPISPEMLEIQDRLLQYQNRRREVTRPDSLPRVVESAPFPLAEKLALWQGDITTLAADAIVNAANAQMLGCFVPLHRCIDNAIHSAAGIQLRLECQALMQKQGHPEPAGQAKITGAYNLPSKFVIHTVGPVIDTIVTEGAVNLLAACYRSCLEASKNQGSIKSLAFCCISTGEFRFPAAAAAGIAINTVCEWLRVNPGVLERVIFNVFSREDYEQYTRLFQQRTRNS